MKQSRFILFFLCICLLGLLAMPAQGSACSGMHGHGCCQKSTERASNEADPAGAIKARATVDENQQDCQMGQTVHSRRHPCGDAEGPSCGHNCHCTVSVTAPFFLPAGLPVLPAVVLNKLTPSVIIPLRLPAGFDFIWRPPKIG